jgi:hypothetical protein
MGALRYHTIKLLCEDDLLTQHGGEPQLELLQNHEIIRPMDQYSEYANALAQNQINRSD